MKTIKLARISVWASFATFLLESQTSSAQPLVYIPMGSDNKIIVVDAVSDTIVNTIDGLDAVHGLAVTPDGRHLIAGSFDEQISGKKITKPKGMSEDEHASHHSMPAQKTILSDETKVSLVSVINTYDESVARVIEVPGAVHHVSTSPDGRYAVVTRPYDDGISVIDLESNEVIANPTTGSLPNYSVFSRDGSRIFVSNAGDNTIALVQFGHWESKTLLSVGNSPEHLVLSNDGRNLYVNNVEDGSVSAIDTKTFVTTELFKIGSTIHGIDISEDGAKLFVASLGSDALVQVDLVTGTKTELPLYPEPYHITTITGSGKLYVSSANDPKLWVVDPQLFKVRAEIAIGGKGHQMVMVPAS